MNNDVKQFAEEVMDMASRVRKSSMGILPGIGGGGGYSNSGTDVTNQLDSATAEFVGLYVDKAVAKQAVVNQAEKIEGLLMMGSTLEVLTEQRVDDLVTKLHDLIEARA